MTGESSSARAAYAAALELLGRRGYFEAELSDRLRGKGFEDEAVEHALQRCRTLGLVDDPALAARFVEVKAGGKGWGPRRLAAELMRRGADRQLAEAAAALPPADSEAALATALRRAEVRAPDGWWELPRSRARMVSSLLRRGFAPDDASAAVDELAAAREEESHAGDDEPGDPGRVS